MFLSLQGEGGGCFRFVLCRGAKHQQEGVPAAEEEGDRPAFLFNTTFS